jgi:AraC-like DNA-binding protein
MENLHSMGDQFLTIVNRIIDENLADEHFSVEDLAKHAGLSRSMLHRKLVKLTGKSATDLITERRLMQAKELLENDAGTASEIAYKVGFGSPSYFHRVFKKHLLRSAP